MMGAFEAGLHAGIRDTFEFIHGMMYYIVPYIITFSF